MRGEGLNIFHSIDNDSPQFLKQQFNTWVALDTLEGRYRNRAEGDGRRSDPTSIRRGGRRYGGQARRIKRRKLPQFDLLARWLWRDPRLIGSAAELAVGKLSR